MGKSRWIAAGLGLAVMGAVAAAAQSRETEQPNYETVLSNAPFELRDYTQILVAEVTHTGTRRQANGANFRRLAAYIFAQDRPDGSDERIAMTAPVLQDRVVKDQYIAMTAPVIEEQVEDGAWRMRFVMPSRFTMDTLPTPPSDITLSEIPARRMAAVRFSGFASSTDLAIMEEMLKEWLEKQALKPLGDFEYAFYDAPSVPPRMRRNEVLIEVAAE